MFRSKQQNSQPNREASTASESASPRAIAPQRGSRSAAPGRRQRAGRREAGGEGLRFLPRLPSGPHSRQRGPAASGCRPKQEEWPAGLDLGCRLCQRRDGWAGAGTGAAFHLGASAVPSHPVSCALGPGYPSCRAANTCVLRTWGGVCSHWRLSNQQPWGPTSTPRADMFPELQGTQAPSLHMRGLWLPSQG